MTTVMLVGPRGGITSSLAGWLTGQPDLAVGAVTDNRRDALLQAERLRPAVLVIAGPLDREMSRLCEELRAFTPRPRSLVVDGCADESRLVEAVESGADGYIAGDDRQQVIDAVSALCRGESVVPPTLLGPLLRGLIDRQRAAVDAADRVGQLTRREREVLGLLAKGLDQGAIAQALFISPETARTHVQRLLRKLDVRSRSEAVLMAERSGLLRGAELAVERSAS